MLKTLLVTLVLTILSTGTTAQVVPGAKAEASRDVQGITVRFQLTEPRQRVAFADQTTIRDLWRVTTPGVTLTDGAIVGDQPFEAFELSIAPDAAEVDRIYPGLSLAGDGRVVYGPALMLEGLRTSLAFNLAPGEIALPETGSIEGYAYIGPAMDVDSNGGGDVIAGANVELELSKALRHSFFGSMAFYENWLGAGLPFRPALIGSIDSPGPASFRGDVTNTGVISARFHGATWRSEIQAVTPFIWHETFHLWNGHATKASEADDAPWLHEGGADYAAIVGAVSTGSMSETEARVRIARRLNGCRRTLGSEDLVRSRLRSGSGPYDCGVLIQWLADLELREAGRGNVLGLWKTMLASARVSPEGYGTADFRALLIPNSAVVTLLDGRGETRWTTIETALASLGVSLVNRPTDQDLRGAALMHVAEINCSSGSFGFYDDPGALKLDGADCGVLSGEPMIVTVEDHDPHAAARAMFDAVQARCAQDLTVRYRTDDDRLLEAACDKPLEEPVVWAIADAPSLSVERDVVSRP